MARELSDFHLIEDYAVPNTAVQAPLTPLESEWQVVEDAMTPPVLTVSGRWSRDEVSFFASEVAEEAEAVAVEAEDAASDDGGQGQRSAEFEGFMLCAHEAGNAATTIAKRPCSAAQSQRWLRGYFGWLGKATDASWKSFKHTAHSLVQSLLISQDTEDACKQIWKLCGQCFSDVPALDLFLGLLIMNAYYQGHISPPPTVRVVDDPAFAQLSLDMMHHASGSYGWKLMNGFMTNLVDGNKIPVSALSSLLSDDHDATLEALRRHTGLRAEDILDAQWRSSAFCPGHYVALDHERALIVVSVRGTWGIRDTIADLLASSVKFEFSGCCGFVHSGILRCAERKMQQVSTVIESALRSYPSYRVAVTGHSLGGGVSELLAMLLAKAHPEWAVHAYSFAPAAVLSRVLAVHPATRSLIDSYVYNDDLVPRLSLGSMELLKATVTHVLQQSNNNTQRVFQYVAGGNALGEYLTKKIEDRLQCKAAVDVSQLQSQSPPPETLDNPTFLLPGGRVFYLAAVTSPVPTVTTTAGSPPPYMMREVPNDFFCELAVTADMFVDHLPHRYEAALLHAAAALRDPAEERAAAVLRKLWAGHSVDSEVELTDLPPPSEQ
eukprot:TRINITY_DN1242_c0_g2_i1.p1 TRINITY_DN1242_c0_g2~~TRINITY_DN1242_c0_g2_i1.p1  ORF type:complete len:607 (+),score=169.47 TRINITY_DN1242_c0_g2_i1:7-1827(+)